MIETTRCQQPGMEPEALAMIVGDNGIAILDAIGMGASDTWMIHAFTGLPLPCVDGRIPVLERVGLIETTRCGRLVLSKQGKESLFAIRMA